MPGKEPREMTVQEIASDADELVPFAAEYTNKQIKIRCSSCGQKLDVTELEPFLHIACPVCGEELTVPMHFDRYMLEYPEKREENPFFKFYLGFDMILDRKVCITVLRPSFASDPEMSSLFLQETIDMGSINHFAVVPVYNCGTVHNIPYAVSQYMENGSLKDFLQKDPSYTLLQAVTWIRDAASGLACAFEKGILHRDLSMSSLMLTDDLHIKIGRFASRLLAEAPGEEKSVFLAPERRLAGRITHPGDIYSLGVIFYRLLTGEMPSPDPRETLFDNIPGDFRLLMEKMLHPDPDFRASGNEVEAELTSCIEKEKRLKRRKKAASGNIL